ncbi:AraC family transcriptional regulator [Bosea sp. (in: a-proteobacteria)]|jgi:AraC-like DNA-binding protein|uniref:AraC family transcriptional regulator n=1 Tax=Bosea sp. (in: a-proteobacteria) TaxID=1871050 RepID=UPI002DDCD6D7|nr:AraC family transcriptional regulator [Bosea sp. (in: a-proteobacteria)]HEV2508354.1 AraC family transcriptional regulator [Bosea sp. (in: a-proteobacteria)]
MLQPVSSPVARLAEPASPGIRRALSHIERHFTEALYLDDLASLAGLSVCRFVTVFRRQVGLTPHRFVCRERVRYARALLADGVPAAQAALEAGFFDQSHLSRHFKSVYGVTPGRYLRELVQAPPSRMGRIAYPAPTAFSSIPSSRPA